MQSPDLLKKQFPRGATTWRNRWGTNTAGTPLIDIKSARRHGRIGKFQYPDLHRGTDRYRADRRRPPAAPDYAVSGRPAGSDPEFQSDLFRHHRDPARALGPVVLVNGQFRAHVRAHERIENTVVSRKRDDCCLEMGNNLEGQKGCGWYVLRLSGIRLCNSPRGAAQISPGVRTD